MARCACSPLTRYRSGMELTTTTEAPRAARGIPSLSAVERHSDDEEPRWWRIWWRPVSGSADAAVAAFTARDKLSRDVASGVASGATTGANAASSIGRGAVELNQGGARTNVASEPRQSDKWTCHTVQTRKLASSRFQGIWGMHVARAPLQEQDAADVATWRAPTDTSAPPQPPPQVSLWRM